MLRLAHLTSVGIDLACQLFPNPFVVRNRRASGRRKMGRARRWARLELDRLEDRTLLAAAISGSVWNDLNGDGLRSANEPGLSGQTVFLDLNNNGKFDSNATTVVAPSTTFNSAGAGSISGFGYRGSSLTVAGLASKIQNVAVNLDITNNSPDPVQLSLISPLGFTVPQLPLMFTLQPGDHFVGTIDGNSTNPVTLAPSHLPNGTYAPQQSFADPHFFIDNSDANGTWALTAPVSKADAALINLKSWSLTFTQAEPSAVTDAGGHYSFTGLSPATYQVGLSLSNADVLTAPVGTATQSVTVTADQTVSGIDFGIKPAADLTSVAFTLPTPATAWGQTIPVNYTLTNRGLGDAGAFDVSFYLSNNGVISATGTPLGTVHINGLAAGASINGSATVTLPAAPPAGFSSLSTAYLGSVIDPTNAITDGNRANNSNQGAGIDLAVLGTQSDVGVATGSGVKQSPSIAVDPTNANHLIAAYMDYTLLKTGYAGIGVAVSNDGGKTWTNSSVPVPAGFDDGASDPTVAFDADGNAYVSFMAAKFLGATKPALVNPDTSERSLAFQSDNGIFVARSSKSSGNGGLNWDTPAAVTSNTPGATGANFDAFPRLAIDTVKTMPDGTANPYYGSLYVAYTRFYAPGNYPGDSSSTAGSEVQIAVSDAATNGQVWATQYQNVAGTGPGTGLVSAISDPNYSTDDSHVRVRTPSVTVGAGGAVYVSTFAGGSFNLFSSKNGARSTLSGGKLVSSFVAPDYNSQLGQPLTFLGILVSTDPTLPNDQFRTLPLRQVVADPNRAGVLYALAPNAGDVGGTLSASGILFATSTDYGLTWTSNFTVGTEGNPYANLTTDQINNFSPVLNDDNGGQFPGYASSQQTQVTSSQAMPSMTVSPNGTITVIWYDTRSDVTGKKLEVWGTVSTDGGNHFSPNFQLTDTAFDPNTGSFTTATGGTSYFLGDQLGVAATGNTAFGVWTDTRNGNQNIYFGSYALNPSPAAGADRFSPNNTSQTAADLGQVTVQQFVPRLTLPPGASDEWFRLQAGASGELSVSVTASSGGNALQLQLTDSSGKVLPAAVTNVTDASGAVIGQELGYPSVAGQTYLVHVSSNSTSAVNYTLSAAALTGDFGTQAAGQASGTLAATTQNDYRYTAAVTGSLGVTLTAASNVTGALTVTVLSADGQTVLASGPVAGAKAGASVQANLSVTAGQVVVIQVSGFDATSAGDFTLQFTNLDQFEATGIKKLFFATVGDPTTLVAADLNGDKKLDLLVANTNTTDTLGVLLSNGDGTFQSEQQYDVGPGLSGTATTENRTISVGDFNGDGNMDVVVPNFRSADVSVLLGRGDGTVQPQHRFDAVPSPDATLTGDFTGDGKPDLIVLENFAQGGGKAQFAFLAGRGDGTFLPPVITTTAFGNGAGPMVAGDFNGDGKLDLIVFSKNESRGQIFLGNGDGTFRDGGFVTLGDSTRTAVAADLNGDGKLDLVIASPVTGSVEVLLGNGDGTFQAPVSYVALAPQSGDNIDLRGLAVVDFGNPSGGGPDGRLDIVVSAASRSGRGSPEVILLPGLVDGKGNYAGFGTAQVLAQVGAAGPIVSGNFGSGGTDLAVADKGGVTILFGKPPSVTANATAATARNLGSAPHLVTPAQTIAPGHQDAYFTYPVPTEAAPGSGPQVIDFAAAFQAASGPALQFEVRAADGTLLGSGPRFRVQAAQGAVLTLHVFAPTGGAGSFSLDVDVLPQVVSVQAQSALPGGPATSIVITLQGDRLDPATVLNPANYTVTWFGPDGLQGTADDQVIPVAATDGGQPIVYDPGADVKVSSGLTYQTDSRQTITLLFANPLPAGSYEVKLSSGIQTAALNSSEAALLSDPSFGGHPLVAVKSNTVVKGNSFVALNLVTPAGTPSPNAITNGTSFMTQLQNDLSALLDTLLSQKGDDPSITAALNNQILARFVPGYSASGVQGATPETFAIFWLDPVSIGLQTPQQGQQVTYNLANNKVTDTANQTYVSVGGNVEVIVVAGVAGTFNLDVSNVPATARGGVVVLAPNGNTAASFTDGLRSGTTNFVVSIAEAVSSVISTIPPVTGTTTTPPATTTTVVTSVPGPTPGEGTTNTSTASTGETATGLANAAAPVVNFANNVSEALTQALVTTVVVSIVDYQASAGTSFISTGSVSGGPTSGLAASGITAAVGGTGAGALGLLIKDVQDAVDAVFAQVRTSGDAVANASTPYVAAVVEIVEKAAGPITHLLEEIGGKALVQVNLPWRDIMSLVSQSGGVLTSEFFKLTPALRLKSILTPLSPAHSDPKVAMPEEEEGQEEEVLWEHDFSEAPTGESPSWEVSEYWPALLLVSGAYHAWMRDSSEDKDKDKATTSKKAPVLPIG